MKRAAAASSALLLLLLGCGSPTEPSGNVLWTELLRERDSGIVTQRAGIITSRAELAALWREIMSTRSPEPPLPEVDFRTHVVLFAAGGHTGDSCRRTLIESVEVRAGRFQVGVKDTRPPRSCVCPPINADPVHVISVPAVATVAQFGWRQVTEGPECTVP